MIPELGNFLRKLRQDRGLLLKDMAEKLDYSAAFLSAVELGRKPAPEGLAAKIISVFTISPESADHLRALCNIRPHKITPHTLEQNVFLESLARGLDSMSSEDFQKMKHLLGGTTDESN